MGAHVYMLRCADDSFYVGSATGEDLTLRIAKHQAGTFEGYTSLRRPVELVWSEYFDRITDAIATERRIKGWSQLAVTAILRGPLRGGLRMTAVRYLPCNFATSSAVG
jgi:putative endonuclease